MAMVLSSQSRLLVALCFTLLVLAGALAVGSFTGWFQQGFSSEPVPAKLRQVLPLKKRQKTLEAAYLSVNKYSLPWVQIVSMLCTTGCFKVLPLKKRQKTLEAAYLSVNKYSLPWVQIVSMLCTTGCFKAGASFEALKMPKSAYVAEGYIEESIATKNRVFTLIVDSVTASDKFPGEVSLESCQSTSGQVFSYT